MKFILVAIAALFCTSNAIRSVTHQKITKIMEKKGWAQTLLNMAELHMLNKGPVEDLVAAMDDVTNDLESKLERSHTEYEIRTDQHHNEVQRLTNSINKAKTDIQGA